MSSQALCDNDRSNADWLTALQDEGSTRQQEAFYELGLCLRRQLLHDIRRRAPMIAALAPLAQPELEALADDIVQEALFRIYKNLAEFVDRGSFVNFSLVVARRILIDEFRKKQWTTAPLSFAPSMTEDDDLTADLPTLADLPDLKQIEVGENAILRQMVQIIYQTIEEDMSEDQARVFMAYYFANLSAKQIAAQMGRSQSAVDQLKLQARLKIKRRLQQAGYDSEDLK